MEYTLDARNLLCPLPVIRTQEQVKEMEAGDTLKVVCTDPGAMADIPAWSRIHGHEVLASEEKLGEVVITLKIACNLS